MQAIQCKPYNDRVGRCICPSGGDSEKEIDCLAWFCKLKQEPEMTPGAPVAENTFQSLTGEVSCLKLLNGGNREGVPSSFAENTKLPRKMPEMARLSV